jgi:hypothetical protein
VAVSVVRGQQVLTACFGGSFLAAALRVRNQQHPFMERRRDMKGRYYINTPDLLSSDTDINSPESLFPPASMARNPSNDTIVPGNDGSLAGKLAQNEVLSEYVVYEDVDRTSVRPESFGSGMNHLRAVAYRENQNDPCGDIDRNAVRSLTDEREKATEDSFNVLSVESATVDQSSTARLRAGQPSVEPHQTARESSPMNKIATLFRNFPKF